MLGQTGTVFVLLQATVRRALFGTVSLSLLLLFACASNVTRLNSDRIRAQFGSYGVEVLESTDARRVSNLFSNTAGVRVCRTFAMVFFEPRLPAPLRSSHQRILGGESIGEVFRDDGWHIDKKNRYVGSVQPDTPAQRLLELMGLQAPSPLALHVYDFQVTREDKTWVYATIAEIHHPDYLTAKQLIAIYGESSTSQPEPGLAQQLQQAIQ